jgi:intracellular sulfur oxidation DsrE/DsrF family protein
MRDKEVRKMKSKSGTLIIGLFISICLLFVAVGNVFGEGYDALKGLKDAKAVFDNRVGNPKSAALLLNLIHQSFKDKEMKAVMKNPAFVVVFIGPSVKLISKNREGFSAEEHKILDEIANTVSQMSRDGIKLEICLVAAKLFNVDPASVFPAIKHVNNGWISLIGYQTKGYSLVPVY